jgi:predicted amidohydrolase
MQIAIVQLDIAWEDRESNYAKVRKMLQDDPPAPGALVCLPEMFATGFSMNVSDVAEREPRATERFLAQLAQELGVCALGGFASHSGDECGRNECVVFDSAGILVARYGKLHPYTPSGEKSCYTPGDSLVTFGWGEFTVAPFVCYDLRFPEIWRRAVRRGATLMIDIANWPDTRIRHWTALLTARAIENQCYVVGVNRVGADPKCRYTGRSVVIDPSGAIVAEADEHEQVLSAQIDPATVAQYRRKLPFLDDIRDDFVPI